MALVMKTGTFSDTTTIETGLSSIKLITLYRTAINATSGLLSAVYHETAGCQYTGITYSTTLSTMASGYSTSSFTINGGTVTYDVTGNNGIASGQTYTWIAYGEE